MELTVSLEEMRKRKLMIATPMYGGMSTGLYTKSMVDLSAAFAVRGMHLQFYFLFNESLITRARNYCADEFIRSECTHLLFLDSDIGFNTEDVLGMLAMQSDESPYDIIGAPYPKKVISWEKIKLAVDRGLADKDPTVLDKFVGDYVFNPKAETTDIELSEPLEVLEIGTGFMMIRKKTFEVFSEKFPDLKFRPDHVRTEHFNGSREIGMYFQAAPCPRSNRYLSEDYWFCQMSQEAGLKVWLCPWMATQHAGSFIFGGSLVDIATLGASPTA